MWSDFVCIKACVLVREHILLAHDDLRSGVKTFKRGDHVEWNSEAGCVRGVILKSVVSDVNFKGYIHHAAQAEPHTRGRC